MTDLVNEVKELKRLPSPAMARQIRQEARVTQQRLASELGVQRVTVARWESGQRRPRGDLALRYGRVLAALQREMAS